MAQTTGRAVVVAVVLGALLVVAVASAFAQDNNTTATAPPQDGATEEVLDLNAFESLGLLLVVGLAFALAIHLVRRRGASAWLALVIVAALASTLVASEQAVAHGQAGTGTYGFVVPTATADGTVHLPRFDALVCVAAPGAVGPVTFAAVDGQGTREHLLSFDAEAEPACKEPPAHVDLVLEDDAGAQVVRVLVLQPGLERMRVPGVQLMAGAGDAVVVPRLDPNAGLSVLTEDPFVDVAVFDGGTFERLEVAYSLVQRADLMVDRSVDHPVWVVQLTGATDGQVRLLWEDDDWVRLSPAVGDVLAVTVLALFVTLFRGRPGGASASTGALRVGRR